jgi:hypothetical protein
MSDVITHFSVGLSVMEVPITVRYDVPNKHKCTVSPGWRFVINLVYAD